MILLNKEKEKFYETIINEKKILNTWIVHSTTSKIVFLSPSQSRPPLCRRSPSLSSVLIDELNTSTPISTSPSAVRYSPCRFRNESVLMMVQLIEWMIQADYTRQISTLSSTRPSFNIKINLFIHDLPSVVMD